MYITPERAEWFKKYEDKILRLHSLNYVLGKYGDMAFDFTATTNRGMLFKKSTVSTHRFTSIEFRDYWENRHVVGTDLWEALK